MMDFGIAAYTAYMAVFFNMPPNHCEMAFNKFLTEEQRGQWRMIEDAIVTITAKEVPHGSAV